ncbi:glycosyltransferase family 9 protein [Sphingobium mellinum]|uniref:glycosyltransferase family 9 protein n=1 Tax=Sphingobium mellinum TaxID=1387166 RepID=UPI0030EE688D
MSGPVLIYRLGSLGDTLVALPCFHQIARSFPDSDRIVLTNNPVSGAAPALEAVIGGSGLIHRCIAYDVGERSRTQLVRLLLKIRATGARTMIYLAAGRGPDTVARDLKFFRYAGIRRVIGAPTTPDLHDNRAEQDGVAIEPEADRLARTIADLGPLDLADRDNWDLRLTPAELAKGQEALAPLAGKPFLAISIGTKLPANDWGRDNWLALLARLARDMPGMPLVGLGGPGDFAPTERLLRRWPGERLNLCGPLSPRQSAAVLAQASLFIGHDSGPMHLAATAGAPTLGLFGNNNPPRKWHPYGRHCEAIQDMDGVRNIAVDHVAARALALSRCVHA